MGLFDIFSKKKDNNRVPECFSKTSELIDDISNLAYRYSVEEELLEKYNKDGLDINLLNNARAALEGVLVSLGKNIDEYYDNEYTSVDKTSSNNKNFSYSLDALVVIFNNSLDLYSENEEVRDRLNEAYAKANEELNKAKEVLSNDEAIQAFTGLKPVEKVEVLEEVEESESKDNENVEENKNVSVDNEASKVEVADDNSDVDGDLIVNTDSMKIYFIRMSRNENDEINLNLCVENKLDKEVVVKCKEVSVDGVSTEPVFSCSISSGKRVYDKLILKNDIQQLVNFKGTFYMIDSSSDKVIEECNVFMFKED